MNAPDLFTRWAEFYDRLYACRGKDYAAETAYLLEVVRDHRLAAAHTALDVACGTGGHLVHLRRHFEVEGVDRNRAMLAVAQRRLPEAVLYEQDMTWLDLPRRYDVVTCLFGSINYVADEATLLRAISAMARHLKPHGLLLVEPAVLPERMEPPGDDVMRIDESDLRVIRRTSAKIRDGSLVIAFEFTVEVPPDIAPFHEVHEVRLFDRRTYEQAMRSALLRCRFDPIGPAGKGLFIGELEAALLSGNV